METIQQLAMAGLCCVVIGCGSDGLNAQEARQVFLHARNLSMDAIEAKIGGDVGRPVFGRTCQNDGTAKASQLDNAEALHEPVLLLYRVTIEDCSYGNLMLSGTNQVQFFDELEGRKFIYFDGELDCGGQVEGTCKFNTLNSWLPGKGWLHVGTICGRAYRDVFPEWEEDDSLIPEAI